MNRRYLVTRALVRSAAAVLLLVAVAFVVSQITALGSRALPVTLICAVAILALAVIVPSRRRS